MSSKKSAVRKSKTATLQEKLPNELINKNERERNSAPQEDSKRAASNTFKKKTRTIQLLQMDMIPTDEELDFRSKEFKDNNVLEKYSKYFKCTKCHFDFKPVLNDNEKVKQHPLLGVLMCSDCCDYYGDGNFSLDSDGEDKYCRWCGEGGTIFTCSNCICGFCDQCIQNHFGNNELKKIQKDDDWVCYFCNPKPLWNLRSICSLALEASKNKRNTLKRENNKKAEDQNSGNDNSHIDSVENNNVSSQGSTEKIVDTTNEKKKVNLKGKPKKKKLIKPKKRTRNVFLDSSSSESDTDLNVTERMTKIIHLTDTDESQHMENDEEEVSCRFRNCKKRLKFSNSQESTLKKNTSFETKKEQIIAKLKSILTLTKCNMGFGSNWCTKKLLSLDKFMSIKSEDQFKKECEKIKWFISVLSSYLVAFCNSVESIEKSLSEKEESLEVNIPTSDCTTYTSILQFLGFVSNQVKAFNEKGISLEDLVQSEIYDDDTIIGIKKKRQDKVSFESHNYINDAVSSPRKRKLIVQKHNRTNKNDNINNLTENEKKVDKKKEGHFYEIKRNEAEVLKIVAKKVNKLGTEVDKGLGDQTQEENNKIEKTLQVVNNSSKSSQSNSSDKSSTICEEKEDTEDISNKKKTHFTESSDQRIPSIGEPKNPVVDEELVNIVTILEGT